MKFIKLYKPFIFKTINRMNRMQFCKQIQKTDKQLDLIINKIENGNLDNLSQEEKQIFKTEMKESEIKQLLYLKVKDSEIDKITLNELLANPNIFNRESYLKVNDPVFEKMLVQQEMEEKYFSPRNRYKKKEQLVYHCIPLWIIVSSLFMFYLYQTVPHRVLIKHSTISEYLFQKNYQYAAILQGFNYMNILNMSIYFPGLLLGLFNSCKFYNGWYLSSMFIFNSLLSTGVHYSDQRLYQHKEFMRTQIGGPSSTLFFVFLPLITHPNYKIFRRIPYWILPVLYLINEYIQFKCEEEEDRQIRWTHISSIINGLLLSLIVKKRMFIKV